MKRLIFFALLLAVLVFAFSPARAASLPHKHFERIVLGGGCFWGMEAIFERLRGVQHVTAGFSGGSAETAHYETVSTGLTGHAESVEITFDPTQLSYDQLLNVYFRVAHDPTELNYQGPDQGSQYRSVIFYTTEVQRHAVNTYMNRLKAQHVFKQPIVTEVSALRGFYPAEAYHQHYYDHHLDEPYIIEEDVPKVKALEAIYPELLKAH